MKSVIGTSFLAIALMLNSFVFAQTSTKGFSFQGYAIDPDGKTLASENITVRFTLTSTSASFTEDHTLTSDAFGVFHAVIGNSSVAKNAEFSKLDFTKKGEDFTLKVEVAKTSLMNFTTISNEPMNAVPYARKAENGVPVCTMVAFGGDKTKVPEGWLLCDGTAYNSADYPQLFASIGTGWGDGSTGTNSTTGDFNVPDTRGEFLRGAALGYTARDPDVGARYAMMTGGNTGDNVGSGQWNTFTSHGHTGTTDYDGWHQHQYTSPTVGSFKGMSYDNSGSAAEYPTENGALASGGTHQHNFTTNASGGSETRPNNVYVYYIIKY